MVEVKIPKIIKIDKEDVLEHLEGFVREILYNYICGELYNELLKSRNIEKICFKYYWSKFNKTGQVVFTHEEVYNHNMNNGRKFFKDSCYAKIDWIVLIDALDRLIKLCCILTGNLHMQNPDVDAEVKKDVMYSVIISELLQEPLGDEESDEEDRKDKQLDRKLWTKPEKIPKNPTTEYMRI